MTSPQYWINVQTTHDLSKTANRSEAGDLEPDAAAWIDQALRHADRIDPLTPTPVSALNNAEADLRPNSAWQIPDD